MQYNPLKKLLYRGSLKEDKLKTIEDLSKVYKIIGLEKLVSGMESRIGRLESRHRVIIYVGGYLGATFINGLAIYSAVNKDIESAKYYAIMGSSLFLGSLAHQYAKSQKENNNSN